MAHESDFLRLNTACMGALNIRLNKLGLDWPPPEFIVMDDEGIIRKANEKDKRDFILERVSMSKITDEQIATMDHVARGAEYKYLDSGGVQSE